MSSEKNLSTVLLLAALFSTFLSLPSFAVEKKIAPRTGVVVFTKPPSAYLYINPYKEINDANVRFYILTWPNGTQSHIDKGGVLAILEHPNSLATEAASLAKSSTIAKINGFLAKRPENAQVLISMREEWEKIPDVAQLQAEAAVKDPSNPPLASFTHAGTTYLNVWLVSVKDDVVTIGHDGGMTKVDIGDLSPDESKLLNTTSKTVVVDTSAPSSADLTSSPNPTPTQTDKKK